MQTDFEAMGGTYTQVGDYLLPDVEAPESPQIGIWGERRRKYLQKHDKATYTAMLLGDTLNAHLEEVDKSASEMFEQLVAQYKEQEGITEPQKAVDQWEWFRKVNSIGHRVLEVIDKELIHA